MIFRKSGLLSIILISAPTLAADTASYAVELSHLHEAQLSLHLTDASGNPIPEVQNISLTAETSTPGRVFLEANRILEGSKLKSNHRLQAYTIKRTLKPINFNHTWMDHTHPESSYISAHISRSIDDCDEVGYSSLEWTWNTDAHFTTEMPAGLTSMCSTNISYQLKKIKAGAYTGALTLHITPKL